MTLEIYLMKFQFIKCMCWRTFLCASQLGKWAGVGVIFTLSKHRLIGAPQPN